MNFIKSMCNLVSKNIPKITKYEIFLFMTHSIKTDAETKSTSKNQTRCFKVDN